MIAAIIQARMGSTRLPGKILVDICGKPVLWHVVTRIARSKKIGKIIVATTTNPEDDAIEHFCIRENLPLFRGSPDDVLDRYYHAAKTFSADHIVRITADCPLHDAEVVDHVIEEYLNGSWDYATNTLEYTYPDGLDVEVFSFQALETAWKNAVLGSEREHVTPYIRNNPAFRKKNVVSKVPYPQYRLTVDTHEDLAFVRKIFEGIGHDRFGIDKCAGFLKEHPHLLEINQHIGMNEGYIKSLVQDAKNVVLHSERLYLRHLVAEDASDQYVHWINDPEINCFLESKKTTRAELVRYISEKYSRNDCLFFGIFTRDGDQHIGNLKLEPIDFSTRSAVLGILIGDHRFWGKGICAEAIKTVVEYSFTKMNLVSVTLGVISDNTAAIFCYKKSGFMIEKTEPLTGINANGKRNKIVMSIRNPKKT